MANNAPNTGLNYGWALGESGYNLQMDENLQVIDALLVSGIASATLAEPPSTEVGVKYLIPSTATGVFADYVDHIAICLGVDLWHLLPPRAGWEFKAVDTGLRYSYDGTTWNAEATLTSLEARVAALEGI